MYSVPGFVHAVRDDAAALSRPVAGPNKGAPGFRKHPITDEPALRPQGGDARQDVALQMRPRAATREKYRLFAKAAFQRESPGRPKRSAALERSAPVSAANRNEPRR